MKNRNYCTKFMRITGGNFRSRQISTPSASKSSNRGIPGFKPSMDKVRAAVFSSLYSHVDMKGARILDLYAGTGSYSFESISRGANSSTLIEKSPECCRAIRQTASDLGVLELVEIIPKPVERAIVGLGLFDIVFIDPPYGTVILAKQMQSLVENSILSPESIIVYEDRMSVLNSSLSSTEVGFFLLSLKAYGDSGIAIFKKKE